jgi:hypothetical protein
MDETVLSTRLAGGRPRHDPTARGPTVAKVPPFHSKDPNDPKVFHTNNKCTKDNIAPHNRVSGTGGRGYTQCIYCSRMH